MKNVASKCVSGMFMNDTENTVVIQNEYKWLETMD